MQRQEGWRRRLIGSAALAALAAFGASPVIAADDEGTVAELIVTAQKRAERIQDAPLAVSAFDDAALGRLGVQDAEDLAALVPNFQFGTTDVNARVAIRGVGTGDTNFAADPGVAFHVDGVYQARASGAATAALFDVERVEVLRGPQGTLYGRNATGGAVNLISAAPVETFAAYAEGLYGSYDRIRLRGYINLPISETLAARVTAHVDNADGYLKNLNGPDLNDRDELFLRGQLRFAPTPDHEVLFRLVYSGRGGRGSSAVVIEPFDNRPGNLIIGGGGTAAAVLAGSRALAATYATALPNISIVDPQATRQNSPSSVDTDTYLASLEYNADLGALGLKLLASYQYGDEVNTEDSDRTELFIATRFNQRKSEARSLEANLTSPAESRLKWILGAFYMEDEVHQYLLSRNSPAANAIPLIRDDYFDGETLAGFGQATYEILPNLSATLGARYTRDKKSGSQTGQNFNGAVRVAAERDSWSEATYRLGLDYKATPDNLVYATFSTGYKAGGFRFLPTVGANDPDGAYRPETVDAIEIGSKNAFFDRRLIMNLTGFDYSYQDLQFVEIRDQQQIVSNIGAATVRGLELEANARPAPALSLIATVAYLKTRIDRYVGPDPRFGPLNPLNPVLTVPANINPNVGFPINVAGNRLPQSPKWSVNLIGAYDFELPGVGVLTPQVRYAWQSAIFFTPFNSAVERQKAYDKVDLSLTLVTEGGELTAEAFVQNLGDTSTRNFVFNGSATTGTLYQATYAAPRTWGVRLARRF